LEFANEALTGAARRWTPACRRRGASRHGGRRRRRFGRGSGRGSFWREGRCPMTFANPTEQHL
jgi:hypothetical protein